MKKVLIGAFSILLGYELSALFLELSPFYYGLTVFLLFFGLTIIAFRAKEKLIFSSLVILSFISVSLFTVRYHSSDPYYTVRNDLTLGMRQLEKLQKCPDSFEFVSALRDQYDLTHKLKHRQEEQKCIIWSAGPDETNDNAEIVFDAQNLVYSSKYLESSISPMKRLFARDQIAKGDIVVQCEPSIETNFRNRGLKCVFL